MNDRTGHRPPLLAPAWDVSNPNARLRHSGRHTVVVLRGEIDLAGAPGLTHVLHAATVPSVRRLIVDLRPVRFFDCTTLGLLCSARRRMLDRGGSFCVVCGDPRHLRLMSATGLLSAFRPAPTLRRAYADLAADAG